MTSHTDLDVWRRQLRFRSWHRGTKELDLILGPFADARIDEFGADELAAYAELLQEPDPDLYDWVTEKRPPPRDFQNIALDFLIDFHRNRHRAGKAR